MKFASTFHFPLMFLLPLRKEQQQNMHMQHKTTTTATTRKVTSYRLDLRDAQRIAKKKKKKRKHFQRRRNLISGPLDHVDGE